MASQNKNIEKRPVKSVEVTITNQRYVIRGEETEEHLQEVAEMVKRKVESLRKRAPTATLQKAAMLAAFDFASDVIKGKKRSSDYRAGVLTKAQQILEKVELELEKSPS
jgi:cell division protein ZapA (FtsZ GTPase activity inhibitor)